MENGLTISFVIVIVAGATDVIDGWIARRYNLITKVGIVLDPLADKLMLMTVVVSLTLKDILPIWILLIVAIKESLMIIGATVLHNKHDVVIPANKVGKTATIAFYVAILAIAFKVSFYMIFVIIFVLLTVISFTIYISNFRIIKKNVTEEIPDGEIEYIKDGIYQNKSIRKKNS